MNNFDMGNLQAAYDAFEPYTYQRDISVPVASAPDTRGEFAKAWTRGVEESKGLLYGAAGATADMLGNKNAAGYLYSAAADKFAEAEKSAPRVGSFTDIKSIGDGADYVVQLIGSNAPSMLATMGAGIVGAKLAQKLGETGLKNLLKNQIAKQVASGLTEAQATKMIATQMLTPVEQIGNAALRNTAAKNLALREALPSIGATVGGMASTGLLETGQNWMQDVEAHGLQDTRAGRDILGGLASGAIEMWGGPERMLTNALSGRKVLGELASPSRLGRTAQGMLKGAASEGLFEEGSQYALGSVASRTPFKMDEFAESVVGGSVMGGLFGGAGGMFSAAPKQPGTLDPASNTSFNPAEVNTSPAPAQDLDKLWVEKQTVLSAKQEQWQTKLNQVTTSLSGLEQQNSQLAQSMKIMSMNKPPVNASPQVKATFQQSLTNMEQQIAANAAKMALLKKEKTELETKGKDSIKRLADTYDQRTLEAEARDAVNKRDLKAETILTADPSKRFEYTQFMQTAQDFTEKELTKASQRMYSINKQIADLDARIAEQEMSSFTSPDLITQRETLKNSLESEQKFVVNLRETAANTVKEFHDGLKFGETWRRQNAIDKLYAMKREALDTFDKPIKARNAQLEKQLEEVARINVEKRPNETAQQYELRKRAEKLRWARKMKRQESMNRNMKRMAEDANKQNQAMAAIAEADRNAQIGKWMEGMGPQFNWNAPENLSRVDTAMNNAGAIQQQVTPAADRIDAMRANVAEQERLAAQAAAEQEARANADYENATSAYAPQEQAAPVEPKTTQQLAEEAAARAPGNPKSRMALLKEAMKKKREEKAAPAKQEAKPVSKKAETVKSWLSETISRLPAIANFVEVVETFENMPKHITDDNQWASIDLATGKIYFVADRVPTKTVAVRTLLHEAVGHFGLRKIMTDTEFNKFMDLVIQSFGGTTKWAELKKQYPDINDKELAEEFVARMAESIRLNKQTMSRAAVAFSKIKSFIKNILKKLGLKNANESDVHDILLASVHYLATTSDPKWKANKKVVEAGEFRRIRNSVAYETWFDKASGFVRGMSGLNDPILVGPDGKKSVRKATWYDNMKEAHGDTVLRFKYYVKLFKAMGGKIDEKTNFYEVEKPIENRIARKLTNFMVDIVGLDPHTFAPKPKEGTILWWASKMVNGKDITPENVVDIVGNVLMARHALEVNERGREMSDGKITDASGMTDKEANDFIEKYVSQHNAMFWNQLFDLVQKISEFRINELLAAKLLTKQEAAMWRKYKSYVPLQGWENKMQSLDPSFMAYNSRRGLNMSSFVPAHKRMARSEKAVNPLITMIHQVEDTIRATEKVKIGRSFLAAVEENMHLDGFKDLFKIENTRDIRQITKEIANLIIQSRGTATNMEIKAHRAALKELYAERKRLNALLDKRRLSAANAKLNDNKQYVRFDNMAAALEKNILAVSDKIVATKQAIEQIKSYVKEDPIAQMIKERKAERRQMMLNKGWAVVEKDGKLRRILKDAQFSKMSPNTVTVIDEDGNKVRIWAADEHLIRVMKGQNIPAIPKVLRTMGKIQAYMAKAYTTLSTDFIFTNPIRDFFTALINVREVAAGFQKYKLDADSLTKSLFKSYKPAWSALFSAIRHGKYEGEWGQTVKDFENAGAFTTMLNLADFQDTYKRLVNTVGRASKGKDFRQLYAAGFNAMDDISSAFENTARLAVFKEVREQLMGQGMSKEDATARAANIALDLTINFSKRGTHSGITGAFFLFANANIQATSRIIRALFPSHEKGMPLHKRRFTKYAAGLAALGFMLAQAGRMMGGDDDDGVPNYDKIPDWVKEMNIIIMNPSGDGSYLKIPLPYGWNVFLLAGNVMDAVMNGSMRPAEATGKIFKGLFSSFNPMGDFDEGASMFIPTLIRPLVQVEMNQNFFGRPIRPNAASWKGGEQPDSQKYWDSTPEIYVKMAQFLNEISFGSKDRAGMIDISPTTPHYLIQQFAGGPGRLMNTVLELAGNIIAGKTDQIDATHLPIARRFVGTSSFYNDLSHYTKVKTEVETQVNEYKRAKMENLTGDAYYEVVKKTQAGRLLEKRLDAVQKKLNDFSKKEHKLAGTGMSDTSVYEEKKRIQEEKQKLISQFVKSARQYGVK